MSLLANKILFLISIGISKIFWGSEGLKGKLLFSSFKIKVKRYFFLKLYLADFPKNSVFIPSTLYAIVPKLK